MSPLTCLGLVTRASTPPLADLLILKRLNALAIGEEQVKACEEIIESGSSTPPGGVGGDQVDLKVFKAGYGDLSDLELVLIKITILKQCQEEEFAYVGLWSDQGP